MSKSSALVMKIASEISDMSGVQLGDKQESMVSQRLQRRMAVLGLKSESEYLSYYEDNKEEEFKELLSLFTTHHSYFFREFKHFEMLKSEVIPKLIPEIRKRPDKTLRLWSAACSRGQEMYSLAIFIEMTLKELAPDIKMKLVGTDIDSISVDFARNGVYTKKEIDTIPQIYQTGNFVRGTKEYIDYVKVHRRLTSVCEFSSANLVDSDTWPSGQFDIIFCRNVFIYFSLEDIEKISNAFKKKLNPVGYLFLGLTETLNGLKVDLKNIGPSAYSNFEEAKVQDKKVVSLVAAKSEKAPMPSVLKPVVEEKRILKVLCVDDSPTILALLKQTFTKDAGFVVADTAVNGEEALKKIQTQKFDLITLDIHMPVMTGLEFMQKAPKANLPPVLVISSVEREDKGLAYEMLKLGASDYVRKPELKNLAIQKEEILLKGRLITENKKPVDIKKSLDHQYAAVDNKKISGVIGVLFSPNDQQKANDFIKFISRTDVQVKGIPVNGILDTKAISSCQVVVVISEFNRFTLEQIKQSKIKPYLLEEAYLKEKNIHAQFEIYPKASIGYMIYNHLKDRK